MLPNLVSHNPISVKILNKMLCDGFQRSQIFTGAVYRINSFGCFKLNLARDPTEAQPTMIL